MSSAIVAFESNSRAGGRSKNKADDDFQLIKSIKIN